MKDSKNLVIGMLCAVICIMAVAYAAFSTTLNINGTASIESSWGVRIKDAPSCTFKSATASSATTAPACAEGVNMCATATKNSDTLATVNMKFQQPGDTATCTVTYENYGTLDATLTHVVTGAAGTKAIKFTVTGADGSQTLTAGTGTHQVVITGTFQDVKDSEGNSTAIGDSDKQASLSIATTAVQKLS